MQVLATNHTSFTVADLEATVAFFVEALGLSVRWPPQPSSDFMAQVTGIDEAVVRVAVVSCPGHAIELFQYVAPPGRSAVRLRPSDVGFSHLAFRVGDLDEALRRAAAHGFRLERGIGEYRAGENSLRAAYLRGPDGLAIELVATSS
jgi:glyoxylase I family protein